MLIYCTPISFYCQIILRHNKYGIYDKFRNKVDEFIMQYKLNSSRIGSVKRILCNLQTCSISVTCIHQSAKVHASVSIFLIKHASIGFRKQNREAFPRVDQVTSDCSDFLSHSKVILSDFLVTSNILKRFEVIYSWFSVILNDFKVIFNDFWVILNIHSLNLGAISTIAIL